MRESPFYDQIMQEGRLETARAAVLQVISLRFGPEAVEEFRLPLGEITDLEQLKELHKVAILSRRPSELRRAFTAVASGS